MPDDKKEKKANVQEKWWLENEFLNPGVRQTLLMKLIHSEKTPYQKLEVYEHDFMGKVLALDDILQTTQWDEFVYHEMLAHVPLLGRKSAGRAEASVLIIGGGDGGILREVLGYGWVKKVVMVEIDKAVIEVSSKYLGFNGNYEDKRVELIIGDGADYVRSVEALKSRFDVIIIDSTDPIGPGEVLFTDEFFRDVRESLTPTGVMVRHLAIMAYQPELLRDGYAKLSMIFGNAQPFRAAIPSYIGGDMTFILASKDGHGCDRAYLDYEGRYYNPAVHKAAFALPTWWKEYLIKRS